MPGDVANPRIWLEADAYVAVVGTTAPTDIATALNPVATVNNKALTSNVATLTTAAPHGFIVGEVVTVEDVDATFDGTYTVTAVGSTTTFSYAKTATNVASAAATGTATGSKWGALGLLSEDGLTESREGDTTDHYAWGGILVRTTRSKHKRTIQITALEDNVVVWGLVNPGSTAASAGGVTTRTVKVPTTDPRAMILEVVDGAVTKRRVIPRCEVVEVGDVTWSDSEMAMYELTINVYPSAEGVLYYDITDDPQAEVAA